MVIINKQDKYKINNNIKSDVIKLIDPNSEQLKIITLTEGLRIAKFEKLDLVQIHYKDGFPICKILDFKKFIFERKKKEKENKKKNKKIVLKEIYLKPNISTQDCLIKFKQIYKFLEKGIKVKVGVKFLGRELNFIESGFSILSKLNDYLCIEKNIAFRDFISEKIDNKQIYAIFISKKKIGI